MNVDSQSGKFIFANVAFSLMLVFLGACAEAQPMNNQGKFFLKGNILEQDTGVICLSYRDKNGKYINDTTSIKNGMFSFIGFINEPTHASLSGNIKSRSVDDDNFTEFFIEATTMHVIVRANYFKLAAITGSPSQDEANELKNKEALVYREAGPLERELDRNRDSLSKDRGNDRLIEKDATIFKKLVPYKQRILTIQLEFIATHPNSFVSAYLLQNMLSRISIDSSKFLYKTFNNAVQNSHSGRVIAERLYSQPGFKAVDFTAIDVNGNTINLLSFRNKSYVLLDFWASWCIPCRNNNPHLLELYHTYHSSGLEIIGIAINEKKMEAWKNAIQKDNIGIWSQVFQGIGGENDIGKKFGTMPIPTKILINKEGLIIGRYEGSDDTLLDKKLAQIFR
ncbi:MAG: TlpA disulfide reductase family protein [Chitinophagales bacterium]